MTVIKAKRYTMSVTQKQYRLLKKFKSGNLPIPALLKELGVATIKSRAKADTGSLLTPPPPKGRKALCWASTPSGDTYGARECTNPAGSKQCHVCRVASEWEEIYG